MTDKAVKPIPDGYHSVTPYLAVNDAARAIEFYKEALGATERFRHEMPGGKIGHAEIMIGNSIVALADEFPEMNFRSPQSIGGTASQFMIYCEDVDARVEQAVVAGAKLVRPVKDQFYGDRTGMVEDPFGHTWYIATHVEDLTMEEIKKRGEAEMAQCAETASTVS
jgi:PhnB protein